MMLQFSPTLMRFRESIFIFIIISRTDRYKLVNQLILLLKDYVVMLAKLCWRILITTVKMILILSKLNDCL